MINDFKGKYFFLSNFYPCKVTYKGITYPSSEHAYMSAKNDSAEWKATCSNPELKAAAIKKLGRKITLKKDWDDIRIDVMRECLENKFSKESLRTMLLETGDQHLEEGNWWGDTFWGVCNGVGKNNLGKLLMEIRYTLSLEYK